MRVLIHTQKGGSGKTTTAVNLAAALLRHGYGKRVVLVDLDPQQHLTAMAATTSEHGAGTAAFGTGLSTHPVRGEAGLFLTQGAALVPDDALALPDDTSADWTILDSAPAWSPRLAKASHWADLILCPLEPDFFGLSGVGRLLEQIEAHGVTKDRLRFLLTRFNPRLALHREVRDQLAKRFGALVLPVEIRSSVKLAEAPGMGRTIFSHAPGSTGCMDYRALAAALAQALQTGKTAA